MFFKSLTEATRRFIPRIFTLSAAAAASPSCTPDAEYRASIVGNSQSE